MGAGTSGQTVAGLLELQDFCVSHETPGAAALLHCCSPLVRGGRQVRLHHRGQQAVGCGQPAGGWVSCTAPVPDTLLHPFVSNMSAQGRRRTRALATRTRNRARHHPIHRARATTACLW